MDMQEAAKATEALLAQCFPPFLTLNEVESGSLDLGLEQDEFVYGVWEILEVDDPEDDDTAKDKLTALRDATEQRFGLATNSAKLLRYFLCVAYWRICGIDDEEWDYVR